MIRLQVLPQIFDEGSRIAENMNQADTSEDIENLDKGRAEDNQLIYRDEKGLENGADGLGPLEPMESSC